MASLVSVLGFEPLDVVVRGEDRVCVVGEAGRSEHPLEVTVVDFRPELALVLAEGHRAEKHWVLGDLDKVTNGTVLEQNLEDLACDIAVVECAVGEQTWGCVDLEVEPVTQDLVRVTGSLGKEGSAPL